MLKKIGLSAAVLLVGILMPFSTPKANAAVRFGVFVGPGYSYPYGYPYAYGYPDAYGYPYYYSPYYSYGWGGHGWHGHEHHEFHEFHGHEHGHRR
jgi:hypothetical protein